MHMAAAHRAVVTTATTGVGIARAIQAGVALARAPLVARMDGDDICLPDRFARQVERFAADARLGALGTQVEAFPVAGEGLRRYIEWQNQVLGTEAHATQLFVESPLCHPSVMVRRAALDAVGGWRDVAWPEDYDLWLRLDAGGWALDKVPEVLLRWRHGTGRATFADARYGIEQFRRAKAPHLAR